MAKPVVGVVFDADIGGGIGGVLALALLYGLEQKSETRVVGLSTTRPSLASAALMDAFQKFYFGRPLPVGMPETGTAPPDPPMLSAVVSKFRHEVKTLNDTAEPAATIRNAYTAQHDENCIMVLAGPASNLVHSLSLPNVKELAAAKVRSLMVVDGPEFRSDPASARRLFAAWPGSVVVAGEDIGAAVPFPQASIEEDFAWAEKGHPLVEAYRAFRSGAYDAPSSAMAAVLHAVRPSQKYFALSEPATIAVNDDGSLKFTPAANGKHQKLVFDPARKEDIQKAYRELVSVKPVSRFPRRT